MDKCIQVTQQAVIEAKRALRVVETNLLKAQLRKDRAMNPATDQRAAFDIIDLKQKKRELLEIIDPPIMEDNMNELIN